LTLHTVAALAKLYSEQVENITPGPIEAITATGANRLQTIIYAVIPQIVPPYISFSAVGGYRLRVAAKHQPAPVSAGQCDGDRHRHRRGFAGLRQRRDS
jgi:hypothetical protein